MKGFDPKGYGILKKIFKDLRRVNDPRMRWEVTERYLEVLIWIRTLLRFGATVGVALGLVWVYVQLHQTPAQNFLQECQQRENPRACADRWSKGSPNS
ncbi:MAG TPA: hypothetical protein V6C57_16060 [Coleofasciculaceae cyanobacterium]